MEARPVILGVAGGSGSGKSTVVREVVRALGDDTASVLRHDWYYRDLAHLPLADRVGVNFDHPDSLETELLRSHLQQLLAGVAIQAPVYDFSSHTRASGTVWVEPTRLIVLDGILVLAHAELRELMDLAVFVDTEPDVRLIRRIRRDTQNRGRTAKSVVGQYEKTVRPMHLEFVEPSRRHADLTIHEGGHNRVAVELVITRARELLKVR
ncbi:MAG TPA: uridine kinase [Gemmatimonadetes bacterium]|nr:uridine kinase [Gemmatimonadota bacterium]